MFVGRPPFHGENDYLTFQQIQAHHSETMEFPDSVPLDAQDLCRKLLQNDSNERLGAGEGGYAALKAHSFFSGIDWDNLSNIQAPIMPDDTMLPSPKVVRHLTLTSLHTFMH